MYGTSSIWSIAYQNARIPAILALSTEKNTTVRPAGLIFDFDGVLADSLEAHLQAWSMAASSVFNIAPPDLRSLSGHSTRTIAHILSKQMGDMSLATVVAKTKESLLLTGSVKVNLYPGVIPLMRRLTAENTAFGIASNSQRAFISRVLEQHDLEIPVLVSSDDVSRLKPQPDIFWECSNRLKISPPKRHLIHVFEDSPHGIIAARKAGMIPIGITTTVSQEKLIQAGAIATATSVAHAYAEGMMQICQVWAE